MLQYEYRTGTFSNGNKIEYKIFGDTAYHIDTSDKVVQLLHNIRTARNHRIIFEYGDPITGELWGDKETGYIGRSTGSIKVPLVIFNARSHGGGVLLDHCIVRMSYAKGKKVFFDLTK